MEKVELKFLRITYSHTHAGAYALILAEKKGDRRLPIIIGGVEAQAIAIQVENIKPARPLTHDLFKNMSDQLGITLKEVVINDLVEGIFHARLVLQQGETEVEEIRGPQGGRRRRREGADRESGEGREGGEEEHQAGQPR
jgi:bifunctional DNase/RNase